jgi:sodium transport system ATP-binding protein
MVEVQGLRKVFPGPEPVRAVDGVSFRAAAGEVFGLLGPNGAGKTTTLRMLVTLLSPDEGTVRVAGHDVATSPDAVRASIGYLSTSTGVYGRLTVTEMLESFARIQGVAEPRRRAAELVERFELGDYRDQRCGRLSTGNKQKVSIARAMVHDPPVLVLDEPTSGLDVLVAQTFLRFVEDMRDAGKCVVYSTHIMSEAERLCDRLAILHAGRILATGTLDALREQTGEHYLEAAFIHLVEAHR